MRTHLFFDIWSCKRNPWKLFPEGVLHGQIHSSVRNRRTYCIKNCDAYEAARIWVKLYLSHQAYNDAHRAGAFENYYTTTCEGQRITFTRRHYKRDFHRNEKSFQESSEEAVYDCSYRDRERGFRETAAFRQDWRLSQAEVSRTDHFSLYHQRGKA